MPKALTSHMKHETSSASYLLSALDRDAPFAPSILPLMHSDSPTTSPTSPATSRSPAAGPVRANPLHRGEACLTCRRRKMKCDASRPSCGPCSRAGKGDECEYEESRFLATIARLEDHVRILQDRIRELESGSSPLATFDPGFTHFLPPGGRRTPSDHSSDGAHASPYPALSLPSLPQTQPAFQQHQFDQLPAIVTTPAPGDWAGQGLGLTSDIQPNILQRLIGLFLPHAHQFGLPAASAAALPRNTSAALTEAACAAACAFAPRASGLGGYERTFVQRAEAALSRGQTGMHDLQALALLAVLAFVGGRALEGHRHLGGAVRVARALGLAHHEGLGERETWWMVYRAERAWAFCGPAGSAIPPEEEISTPFSPHAVQSTPYAVKQEFFATPAGVQGLWAAPMYALGTESAESLGAKGAALGARAWGLVKDAGAEHPTPQFWADVQTTLAALDRLLSILPHHAPSLPASVIASTTLGAAAALCALHDAVGSREGALGAARRVLGVEYEPARVEGHVAWALGRVEGVLRRAGSVGAAEEVGRGVERLAGWMPFLGPGSPRV